MKTVNIIKKNIVKQSILEGKSFKKSLLDAGYTVNTASHNVTKDNKLLKTVFEEIAQEFDKEKITVEYVLAGLDKEAREAKNSADRIKAFELLGKFKAMFTDKSQVQTEDITPKEKSIIDKYIDTNRLTHSITS